MNDSWRDTYDAWKLRCPEDEHPCRHKYSDDPLETRCLFCGEEEPMTNAVLPNQTEPTLSHTTAMELLTALRDSLASLQVAANHLEQKGDVVGASQVIAQLRFARAAIAQAEQELA